MCNKSKGLGDGSVKMGMLSANRQLELVSINLITVDKASDGRDSILVIADIFTKFTLNKGHCYQKSNSNNGSKGYIKRVDI